MFFEQTKEIIYWKWNTALLVDLIWICDKHVLFGNIFGCFCLHLCMCTNHNNFNFLLINWSVGHNISDFKYWYQCHQIQPNTERNFFYPISLVSVAFKETSKSHKITQLNVFRWLHSSVLSKLIEMLDQEFNWSFHLLVFSYLSPSLASIYLARTRNFIPWDYLYYYGIYDHICLSTMSKNVF